MQLQLRVLAELQLLVGSGQLAARTARTGHTARTGRSTVRRLPDQSEVLQGKG